MLCVTINMYITYENPQRLGAYISLWLWYASSLPVCLNINNQQTKICCNTKYLNPLPFILIINNSVQYTVPEVCIKRKGF